MKCTCRPTTIHKTDCDEYVSYYMRDPFDTMKEISLTHPSLRQGIPDRVGYFWCVESLDPDWPKVSLVLVKDGKVFTFGGKRIPNPKADKMYYQDGIVPPYPTADYK